MNVSSTRGSACPPEKEVDMCSDLNNVNFILIRFYSYLYWILFLFVLDFILIYVYLLKHETFAEKLIFRAFACIA